MELQGKVALVTGAGSGIGRATALRLAAEGAMVGVLSRTASEVEDAAREITAAGGRAEALIADTTESEAMRDAIDRLASSGGRLDIVVANAGINGVWAAIDALRPEEWDRTIAVNLRGTYLTLHHAVPHLKRTGGGSIVITSSINGTRTFTTPGATAYSATKAAQLAMTKMLALELAPDGIRVNAVCPGRIETEIEDNTTPRGSKVEALATYPKGDIPLTGSEPGSSQEVAELILFLASPRARHITGTPVWIDGGQSLLM